MPSVLAPIRSSVRAVLRDMSSKRVTRRQQAIQLGGYLLEQERLKFKRAAQKKEYFLWLVGEEYIGITLTASEREAIASALLGALDDVPSVAHTAAFGLRSYGKLQAIPRLAAKLREWAPQDGWGARQAIIAIWDIITLPRRARAVLSGTDNAVIQTGVEALRFAATVAPEDGSEARRTANQAAASIADWLKGTDGSAPNGSVPPDPNEGRR